MKSAFQKALYVGLAAAGFDCGYSSLKSLPEKARLADRLKVSPDMLDRVWPQLHLKEVKPEAMMAVY